MKENAVKQITVGNLRLTIEQDSLDESPREWDNMGTIAYKHRDYILGEEKIDEPIDWLAGMLGLDTEDMEYTNEQRAELEEKFYKGNKFLALPIFLYDHSGQTIATTPFGCRWDSGKVGYIYVTEEKVIKEYGDFSEESQAKAIACMESEVKTFDQYIRGEVYGFREEEVIKCEACGHIEYEQKDSCCGFYGTDWETNGILDNVNEVFHEELKKKG